MISLDQILVLEQKIESAVAKIAQLTAENDALRSKCAELTNALSAKTEQLSAFQVNQNKIESGIMKALEQLEKIPESTEGTSQAEFEETTQTFEDNTESAYSEDSNFEDTYGNDEAVVDSADSEDTIIDDEESNVDFDSEVIDDNSDVDFSMEGSEEDDEDEETTETFADETSNEISDSVNEAPVAAEKEIAMIVEMRKKGWSIEEIASVMRKRIDDVNAILNSQSMGNNLQESAGIADNQNQADSKPIFDIF